MGRKAHIITTCFNEELNRGTSMEGNLQRALDMLDSFEGMKPDVVCLPEVFLKSGDDGNFKGSDEITAMAFTKLKKAAARLGCYIIAGAHEDICGRTYNVAWLIGRDGTLAGRYSKVYPTMGEIIDSGITPGSEFPVFETDFGKIGIAICYDVGWPGLWGELAAKGAQAVFWMAAYDGGFPLQAYAWLHQFYVVSSVRTNHAKVIDKTGRVLASSSRWCGWASKVIDLDSRVYHIDDQYQKLPEIQRRLGSAVTIESHSEENIFTLESNSDEWPMDRIQKEFGLETYREYHARAERFRNDTLASVK